MFLNSFFFSFLYSLEVLKQLFSLLMQFFYQIDKADDDRTDWIKVNQSIWTKEKG